MFRRADRRARTVGLRLLLALASLVALSVIAGRATPAAAQTLPASLAGESFHAVEAVGLAVGQVDIEGTCTVTASEFTLTYTASGIATGPYPGPYTESGTLTVELTPATPAIAQGAVVSWTAEFTIDSPAGFVRGTKTKTAAQVSAAGCTDIPGFHVFAASSGLSYEATIVTAEGTFVDRGLADAGVNECTGAVGRCGGGLSHYEEFIENFTSSTGVVPASECLREGDDDDEDDEDEDDGNSCSDDDDDDDDDDEEEDDD